jgi:hypothetical protein
MSATNTLAYYTEVLITTIKSFVAQAQKFLTSCDSQLASLSARQPTSMAAETYIGSSREALLKGKYQYS